MDRQLRELAETLRNVKGKVTQMHKRRPNGNAAVEPKRRRRTNANSNANSNANANEYALLNKLFRERNVREAIQSVAERSRTNERLTFAPGRPTATPRRRRGVRRSVPISVKPPPQNVNEKAQWALLERLQSQQRKEQKRRQRQVEKANRASVKRWLGKTIQQAIERENYYNALETLPPENTLNRPPNSARTNFSPQRSTLQKPMLPTRSQRVLYVSPQEKKRPWVLPAGRATGQLPTSARLFLPPPPGRSTRPQQFLPKKTGEGAASMLLAATLAQRLGLLQRKKKKITR